MQTMIRSQLMVLWLFLGVGTALCAPSLSQAVIIKVEFDSVFLFGPLEGESFTGWFTYDTAGDPTEQGNRPGYFSTRGYTVTHPVVVHAGEINVSASSYGFFPFWHLSFRLQNPPTLSTFLPPSDNDLGLSYFQADESQDSVSLNVSMSPKFRQTVVPELSTIRLLVGGIVGLVWIRRRSVLSLFFPHGKKKKRRH